MTSVAKTSIETAARDALDSPVAATPGVADYADRNSVSAGKLRLEYLDSIRGFAALYVVFKHIITTLPLSGSPGEFFTNYLPDPHYAVVVFIVLSGFCLALPTFKRSDNLSRGAIRRFYLRRAFRILPPYLIVLLVSFFLARTVLSEPHDVLWDASLPATVKSLITHALLIHNLTGDNTRISYPLWSIAVECQIYLLFPITLLIVSRIGPIGTTLVSAAILFPLTYSLRHYSLYDLKPHFLVFFCLGLTAAYFVSGPYRERRYSSPHAAAVLCVLAALGFAVLTVIGARNGGYFVIRYAPYLAFAAALSAACFLVGAGWSSNRFLVGVLTWKPLVNLGRMSYSLYLIHAPLIQLGWLYVRRLGMTQETQFVLLSGPGLAGIIAISYVCFLLVERPFMSGLPSFFQNGVKAS